MLLFMFLDYREKKRLAGNKELEFEYENMRHTGYAPSPLTLGNRVPVNMKQPFLDSPNSSPSSSPDPTPVTPLPAEGAPSFWKVFYPSKST
jgi:hypothetical protein